MSQDQKKCLTIIDQFTVVETLGKNARNNVFLAFYAGPKGLQPVVLKVPTEIGVEALRNEAHILSQLKHENIYSIIQNNTDSERPYLALEYVFGIGFEDIIHFETNNSRAGNFALALQLGYQIANTLKFLDKPYDSLFGSTGPIAHGDLGPKNLILGFDGQIKIIDFGCARIISRSADLNISIASMNYSSPARIKNQRVQLHDDFFALGIMMWELCTGIRYWGKLTHDEIRQSLNSFTPRSPMNFAPKLPSTLSNIILTCLHEDYYSCYTNAEEIVESLYEARKLLTNEVPPIDIGQYVRSKFSEQQLKSYRLNQRINELCLASAQGTEASKDKSIWKKVFSSRKLG